jgi:outer membrane protein TolC
MNLRKLLRLAALVLLAAGAARAQQPLTLEEAVAIALERNPALAAAAEDSAAARAQAGQARAAWFPRVDFVQSFTRGNNPVYVFGTLLTQRQFTAANFALPGLNAPTPLNNFQTRFEGQWMLYDWGRTRQRYLAARRMATAADFETEQERQALALRVLRAYYGVVVAREHLAAAREALRTAQSAEERARAMAEAGLVVSSDLLSAQVFRAQMEEREIRAANQLELARMMLGHELGLGPEAGREPADTLAAPAPDEMPVEEWERIALAERPALRAAELAQQAAARQKQLAQAGFGPQVGLFANFERDAERLAGSGGTNWVAGARLEFNLFAGGADRYRLEEAQARERQGERRLEWLRSGIRLELRQAWLELRAARQRAAAARGAVEQAAESLRILSDRYEAGLATMTDLLRAQTAQLDARTGFLAALHDWQVARAALAHAAGRLTPEEIRRLGGEGQ